MNGHLGFVTLGDTLQILAQCVNGSGVASAPDSAPSYAIYNPSGTPLLTGSLGGSDHDSKTGLRRGTAAITSGNGFAVGSVYLLRVAYAVSSTNYALTYAFNVV
jgi:hypothetical protein